MNRVIQIATTYTGSLFALCADGTVWERVKSGTAPGGGPLYKWELVPHGFHVDTGGDKELRSWG